MVDLFDTGGAFENACMRHLNMIRQSGRTTHLVLRANDGDIIVCPDRHVATYVQNLAREHLKDITTDVLEPSSYEGLGNKNGRVLLEHTWSERYYLNAIRRAKVNLERFKCQNDSIK